MAAIPPPSVEYPESDGQPMAESDSHVTEMLDLLSVLRDRFRETPDIYVGANMVLYYEESNPSASIAPDIFVAQGVSKKKRRIFKVWEEGRIPSVVFELTSAGTRDADLLQKKDICSRLGVEEYFLHDVLGEYLTPRLQGFRLREGRYRQVEPAADGSLESRALGLKLRQDGQWLRLSDAATGEPLMRSESDGQDAEEARRKAESARKRSERAKRESDARAMKEAADRRAAE